MRELPYDADKIVPYYTADVSKISDAEFAQILGHAVPSGAWNHDSIGINDALCQMYYAKSGLARKIRGRSTRCLTTSSGNRRKPAACRI